MRRRIDAPGHAADDGQSGRRQILAEPLGRRHVAVSRGTARPHHSQHQRRQQFHPAAGEQQRRRIEDLLQPRADSAGRSSGSAPRRPRASFCCWSTASSKAQPLAMLWATPATSPPLPAPSARPGRSPAGSGKSPINCPALRVPRPGAMRSASQWIWSSSVSKEGAFPGGGINL